jgi:hypothetical protein
VLCSIAHYQVDAQHLIKIVHKCKEKNGLENLPLKRVFKTGQILIIRYAA